MDFRNKASYNIAILLLIDILMLTKWINFILNGLNVVVIVDKLVHIIHTIIQSIIYNPFLTFY